MGQFICPPSGVLFAISGNAGFFAGAPCVHLNFCYGPFLDGLSQLFPVFLLRFGQNTFVDGLACHQVAAHCVALLPASIEALTQTTLAICSFLTALPISRSQT